MRIFYLIFALLICCPAQAQLKEYDYLFKIDLNEKLPSIQKLNKSYQKENADYRWNYKFRRSMPSTFNSEFKNNIIDLGNIEKRIGNSEEDILLNDLKHIPKPLYQYIGPLLHTVRGLSGKILDLPGIKETKNKFPTQIASRFRDIPNIEFASPEMYIYLNPLLWGEELASLEFPQEALQQTPKPPTAHISPEFMNKITAKMKAYDEAHKKSADGIEIDVRHFNADENTPLSKADVRAFAHTLDGLDKFRKNKENELSLIMIGSLINYWDTKNGIPEDALIFRQAVNPCQNFVRKIKWSNMQNEFQETIGEQGFGLNDWAYTCDKVIKAHRVHNAPAGFIWMMIQQKKGVFYPILKKYLVTEQEKQMMRYLLDSYVRMYTTKREDIEAIKPYNTALRDKFLDLGNHLADAPVLFP